MRHSAKLRNGLKQMGQMQKVLEMGDSVCDIKTRSLADERGRMDKI